MDFSACRQNSFLNQAGVSSRYDAGQQIFYLDMETVCRWLETQRAYQEEKVQAAFYEDGTATLTLPMAAAPADYIPLIYTFQCKQSGGQEYFTLISVQRGEPPGPVG